MVDEIMQCRGLTDMKFFKKPSWLSSAPAGPATPGDLLRAEIAALEADLADDERAMTELEARMGVVEARAIDAVRAGDDRAARTAFLEHQAQAEQLATLAADTKVLRAILAECRDFTQTLGTDPAAPPEG